MSWLKSVTADTVVVHTRDGRSIRGVLVGAYRTEVALAHASLLHSGGEDQLDGDVIVLRDNVSSPGARVSHITWHKATARTSALRNPALRDQGAADAALAGRPWGAVLGRPASGGDLPAAGRLVDFEQHLAMLRSCRVALIYAVQNFAQLDDIYGRARRPTIVTNANTHIVLPGTGQEETVSPLISLFQASRQRTPKAPMSHRISTFTRQKKR